MAEQKTFEPVAVEEVLTEQDFIEAAKAVSYFAHPMSRRSIRMAMCFTGAVIMTALTFVCGKKWLWLPVTIAAIFLLSAIIIWFFQPEREKKHTQKWLSSCPLAVLPTGVIVFRDRVVLKSNCETITEYFTDFSLCVETEHLIAAAGGPERFLLIVKKDGMSAEKSERLSGLFRYAFGGRWYRMAERE